MDRFRNIFKYKILPIYWAFLTYLLLKPNDSVGEELWVSFTYMDKFAHIFTFMILSFCYCVSFPRQKFHLFIMLMLLYAVVTEVLQEFMALGRTMELGDIVADILGVILGYFFWKKL